MGNNDIVPKKGDGEGAVALVGGTATTGAAIGVAIGGPIGAAVGGVVGAVAGATAIIVNEKKKK